MQGMLLFALYGGDAWVACGIVIAVVAAATLAGALERRPRMVRGGRVLVLVALVVAAFTGTPLPLGYALVALAVVFGFVFFALDHPRIPVRRSFATATILVAALLISREALHIYRRSPLLAMPSTLVVVGDSITSGGFGERQRWPEIVAEDCGFPVANLSSPSATADDALQHQVPAIPPEATAVFIELGGNDMLDGRRAADFERDLDTILSRLGGRPAFVLEFPVLPGRWSFAAAQRRVARLHGATLIPKRILAAVLTDSRNTFDGLHLNDRGHRELSRRVMPWLGCR